MGELHARKGGNDAEGDVAGLHVPLSGEQIHDACEVRWSSFFEPGLIEKIAASDNLCFDVDLTLNYERGTAIDETAAALIFKFILRGKKIRIISGRTFDEFMDTGTLKPLLRRIRERNIQCDLIIYSAEGGEKVVVKSDGTCEHDEAYNRPFSGLESRQIENAIDRADERLDREHHLRGRGIPQFVDNYRNLRIRWSPYGKAKKNEHEYDFESNAEAQSLPLRKTRRQLGDEIVSELRAAGLEDVEANISGKTTLSFSRKGISKERAMRDILAEGSASYFGDEVSQRGASTGNDNIIGEMADRNRDCLTVLALDGPGGELPEGVYNVGMQLDGTLLVLEQVDNLCEIQKNNGSGEEADLSELLPNYDLGQVKAVSALSSGRGFHNPFKVIESEKGTFVLRHIRKDLYKDPREAARFEVWAVNTLVQEGVPFVPVIEKCGSPDSQVEDNYISVAQDGTCYLLYGYAEGETGSHETMTDARRESMLAALTQAHRVMAEKTAPYDRGYYQPVILAIGDDAQKIMQLKNTVEEKKRRDATYVLTRGERLVLENADFIAEQLRLAVENLRPVYEKLPRLCIHGDYAPPNIIFSGDEVSGIIDFEHLREEVRIYDTAPMVRVGTDVGRFDLENAQRLLLAYHAKNTLTPEEIEALPEIFRLKILDRVCRLVNPQRHHETLEFDFTGVPGEQKTLAIIDRNDRLFAWYQNLILSLRDLDGTVTYGDFRRQIQDRLEQDMSPGQIVDAYLDKLEREALSDDVAIRRLETFSIADMLACARPIEKVFREDIGNWTKHGNYYVNAKDPKEAWCRLQAEDKVFFYTDKVVAYQTQTGIVDVRIRGNDLNKVKDNTDQAHIQIAINEGGVVNAVHMLHPTSRDLSRSSMAIQLTDSGIFDRFPAFEALLRYQLVWQPVDGDLRHREIFDSYQIRLDLLSRAMECPEKVNADEISNIVQFRYFKTRAVRRKALGALAELYSHGRISQSDYSLYVEEFINQDISEDFRVIERKIKNDQDFVRGLFRNLFGMENISVGDIDSIHLEYCGQDHAEQTYQIVFAMSDGSSRTAMMSLIRHDNINPGELLEEDINDSISIWKQVSQAGIQGMVRYGSHAWELDYRDKEIILGGEGENLLREAFVNNVAVCCRESLEGESLDDILKSADVPAETKERAIRACRDLSRQFFCRTEDKFKKGYFIESPKPGDFILTESTDGGFTAVIRETCRLIDYPGLRVVTSSFDSCLPGEFRGKDGEAAE